MPQHLQVADSHRRQVGSLQELHLGIHLDMTVDSHLAQGQLDNLDLKEGSHQHPGLVDTLQGLGLADSHLEQADNLQADLVGSQVHQDIPDIHQVAVEGTTITQNMQNHFK